MMDKHRETYREEARELLSGLETSLLELENSPEDSDLIAGIFRAMHTIKGSGAMFGFDEIASFTHELETVYDKVREGEVTVTKGLIDLTLKSCDQIRLLLGQEGESSIRDRQERDGLLGSIRGLQVAAENPAVECSQDLSDEAGKPGRSATYRIRFKPERNIFGNGTNLIPLLDELKALGAYRSVAHTGDIPVLDDIDPEACYTAWDIILTTDAGRCAIRDVFIFVEDACELAIEVIDEERLEEGDTGYKRLGEILLERRDITEEELGRVLEKKKLLGELISEEGIVSIDKIESALAEQEHVREARKRRQAEDSSSTVRVPAERLDSLVNMVGELVTLQSRLNQTSIELQNHELSQIAEEMERLTADLRDNTMSIRMLPIGTTFAKFTRLVRDLSVELGKEIVLQTEGEETELDKTVIEKLNDPLVHLIRNCIDHGIEKPESRLAAGKPRNGTIRLSATHAGANVLISISDDGAGINRDAVRKKAVEKGLIALDTALSDKELLSLVFAPGFSTAAQVTGVSGRGVGMDVVKRNIDALQGSIETESIEGAGTTITLKLPLTLAIIDGLLVKVEDSFYVMPLSAIEECVELCRADVQNAHGRRHVEIRGEIVPYIHLREHFKIGGKSPDIEQVLTSSIDGSRVGFVVDQVIGQHQTVIKSMGRMCRGVDEVSGATILGDGRVALIIDLPRLVQKAEIEEHLELQAMEVA
jgi:two-component system, chemotaxis family, sensor kinase CheA